jgi:hypothetical protein
VKKNLSEQKVIAKNKRKKSKNSKFTRFFACNFFPRKFVVPSSTSLEQAYNFVLFIPHTTYEKKFGVILALLQILKAFAP